MGNSASTHYPDNHPFDDTSTMDSGGYQFNNDILPPNAAANYGQHDVDSRQAVRVSVTAPTEETGQDPLSTNSGMTMTNDTDEAKDKMGNAKTVPVSTGRSGWVSSTGNSSPWYGSLSSSASSYYQSDLVQGPYYRTQGMGVNRDSELDEEVATATATTTTTTATTAPALTTGTQPSRVGRTKSVHQILKKIDHDAGIPTIITWSQGGQNVYVTGTFNGWKHKIKLVKSTHDFSAVLELPPGTHRLKFIVDDEWKCSNEMETATDPDGNLVNYLQVSDEDENDKDEFAYSNIERDAPSRPDTPTHEYTSEIPADLLALAASLSPEGASANSSKAVQDWERQQSEPPPLPPHLNKVLLNSQTVSEQDNSVLPEPNHVTLNHLYVSSIKDNVMALSTTTRYRKKYVTTMYYQPVFPNN